MKKNAKQKQAETAIKENYLTETKLGKILSDIFKTCKIEKQVKVYGNKKLDYVITLDEVGAEKMYAPLSKLHMKNDIKNKPKNFTGHKLHIEYDGHYHYISNDKIISDGEVIPAEARWVLISEGIYGLRIPYFVQIDEVMSKEWFGDGRSFNDDFPHGFITKKCTMPERFSSFGEERFLREIRNLPLEVSYQIFRNLTLRAVKGKGFRRLMSERLWMNMVDLVYPPFLEDLVGQLELEGVVFSSTVGEDGVVYYRLAG